MSELVKKCGSQYRSYRTKTIKYYSCLFSWFDWWQSQIRHVLLASIRRCDQAEKSGSDGSRRWRMSSGLAELSQIQSFKRARGWSP